MMDDVQSLITATDGCYAWTWNINEHEAEFVHNRIGLSRSRLKAMDFSYDSLFLASCSSTNKFLITSVNKNHITSHENSTENINTTVKFTNSSRFLAIGTSNSKVILYDLKRRKPSLEFSGYGNQNELNETTALYTYEDDCYIASGDSSGNISIHSITNGLSNCAFSHGMHMAVTKLKWKSEKKNLIVSGYDSGAVLFSDVYTMQTVSSYDEAHCSPVSSLVSSSMLPSTIISTGLDKKVAFYDMRVQKVYDEHEVSNCVVCSAFNASGSILAIGAEKGIVKFYDIRKFLKPVKEVSTSLDAPILSVNFLTLSDSPSTSKNAVASRESLSLMDQYDIDERSNIRMDSWEQSSPIDDSFFPVQFQTAPHCKSSRLNNALDSEKKPVDSIIDSSHSCSPEFQQFYDYLKNTTNETSNDTAFLPSLPNGSNELKKSVSEGFKECLNLKEFDSPNGNCTDTGLKSHCHWEITNSDIVKDSFKETCNVDLKFSQCGATESVQTQSLQVGSEYNHLASIHQRLNKIESTVEKIETSLDNLRSTMFDMWINVLKFIQENKDTCIEEAIIIAGFKNMQN